MPLGKRKAEEALDDEKQSANVGGFPLHVGKASKKDPKIKQPEASELGIVPKVAFRFMFTGPSNSGKSNTGRWILDKYYTKGGKSFFSRVYIFSPTAKIDPTWDGVAGVRSSDKITTGGVKAGKQLEEILERNKKRCKVMGRDKAPHELIIVDDSISDLKFMNSEGMTTTAIAGRHANQSLMFMTQSYNKIPRTVRLQMNALCMFPSKVSEIERLHEEHGPMGLNKKQFVRMVQFATQKSEDNKWPFFFMDTDKPEEERHRRNLDTVLVIEGGQAPPESGGLDDNHVKKRQKQQAADEDHANQTGARDPLAVSSRRR
jgi:hypothetical protein